MKKINKKNQNLFLEKHAVISTFKNGAISIFDPKAQTFNIDMNRNSLLILSWNMVGKSIINAFKQYEERGTRIRREFKV